MDSTRVITDEESNYIKLDTAKIFQDHARNMAAEGKFKEALSLYTLCAKQHGPNKQILSDVGEIMINQYLSSLRKHRRGMATDPWSCSACAGVLVEPITLNCGHSSCKKCILKDLKELCKKCGVKYRAREDDPVNDTEYIKQSIIVSELVRKFWSKELSAVELRNEGNKLFQRGEVEASILRYSEAYRMAENDHLLTSNRSHAYYKKGDYVAALEDAERTIELRPDWGKGYFRKGMALKAMGKYGQALIAFFECLLFEETISKPLKADIYATLASYINHIIEEESRVAADIVQSGGKIEAPSSISGSNLQTMLSSIITTSLAEDGLVSQPTLTTATSSAASSRGSSVEHGVSGALRPVNPSVSELRYNIPGRCPPDGCESPSFITASAENSEKAMAGQVIRKRHGSDGREKLLVPRNKSVSRLLDDIEVHMEKLINMKFKPANRDIDPKAVDSNDFDCSLCFRLLWQPVTTGCGHTYCKACLDRSLDHRSECPLCKTKIETLNEQLGVNDFVDQTIRRMLPKEYLERQRLYEEEIADLGGARKDGRVEIPVFVCTMSFPNIPCPLHVFEPRYRLMIRRAMESGAREFGMSVNDSSKAFAEYGTMLEIRDIQYFGDGRSVVDTMGSRRFHVIERGTRDGYNTAVVEFLKDDTIEGEELTDLRAIHDRTRTLAVGWFGDMDRAVQINVTSHYGPMPRVETEYWKLASGPAWAWWVLAILPLDTLAQQQILSQTKLKRRLEAIGRILGYMKRRGGMPN